MFDNNKTTDKAGTFHGFMRVEDQNLENYGPFYIAHCTYPGLYKTIRNAADEDYRRRPEIYGLNVVVVDKKGVVNFYAGKQVDGQLVGPFNEDPNKDKLFAPYTLFREMGQQKHLLPVLLAFNPKAFEETIRDYKADKIGYVVTTQLGEKYDVLQF